MALLRQVLECPISGAKLGGRHLNMHNGPKKSQIEPMFKFFRRSRSQETIRRTGHRLDDADRDRIFVACCAREGQSQSRRRASAHRCSDGRSRRAGARRLDLFHVEQPRLSASAIRRSVVLNRWPRRRRAPHVATPASSVMHFTAERACDHTNCATRCRDGPA